MKRRQGPLRFIRSDLLALARGKALHQESPGIRLDLNEREETSPWKLNRYPSRRPHKLIEWIARNFNLEASHLLVGRGIDDLADFLIRATCRPGQDVMVSLSPSFGMYKHYACLSGVEIKASVLRPDNAFEADEDEILRLVEEHSAPLLLLANPNNPTGRAISRASISRMCRSVQSGTLVVVDEAYIEYAEMESVIDLSLTHENLIVLRTFSKAWGLADLRLGFAVGPQKLIKALDRLKAPFSVSNVIERVAIQNLENEKEQLSKMVQRTREVREHLRRFFLGLPGVQDVYPSQTNFILVRTQNAPLWKKQLEKDGIRVKFAPDGLNSEFVRITIGSEDEIRALMRSLERISYRAVG